MKRTILSLLLIAALAVTLIPAAAAPSAHADIAATIALSLPASSGAFYEGLQNGAQATADEAGVDLLVASADNDPEIELANVQALIEQGAQALLIMPTDPVLSAEAIKAANEAGIPVFLVGSEIDSAAAQADLTIASIITADNTKGGEMAGTFLCEALKGTGTIAELINTPAEDETAPESPSAVAARERSAGFNTTMSESCQGVTLLPFETASLDHDGVVDAFMDLLKENKDISGVFAYNDQTALAALEASIIARRTGVTFVGFDATEDALAAIQQGRLKAIITPIPWLLGESGILTSVDYLAGKAVPASVEVDLTVLDIEGLKTFRGDPRIGSRR